MRRWDHPFVAVLRMQWPVSSIPVRLNLTRHAQPWVIVEPRGLLRSGVLLQEGRVVAQLNVTDTSFLS